MPTRCRRCGITSTSRCPPGVRLRVAPFRLAHRLDRAPGTTLLERLL
jgi:hypothetical protein